MSQYYEDLLIDALLDRGFTLDEALRLIALQQRIEHERRAEDVRRQLSTWVGGLDIKCLLN
jgi:hypothetical protein